MELILQSGLEHQQKAVEAVADVFNNVSFINPSSFFENPQITLPDATIAQNIKVVQDELHVCPEQRNNTISSTLLNLDIKMETGTGKTYVYTNVIYELHKRFGINKFVIAVPSLPIKAGTQQFMADPYVKRHFKDTCGYGSSMELYTLNASKKKKGKQFFPSAVRGYVEGSFQNRNKIYVLLVNMSLLTSGKMLTRSDYDFGVQGFYRPLDAIKATKPFIIIDEPHRFSREQSAYSVILNDLAPQCIIRFGATFPKITIGSGRNKVIKTDYENLLYNLNACASFNQNLIKGVAKEHLLSTTSRTEKVKIVSIEAKTSVSLNYITATGNHHFLFNSGNSLGVISEDLAGLSITGIGNNYIELSNGQTKLCGEEFDVDLYSTSYQEQMIRLALQRHFETEKSNFNREIRIKTLALFFIDNIMSYRGNDGEGAWFSEMFDRLLLERINIELQTTITPEYKVFLEASKTNLANCRAAYFSQDNNDSDENIAKEVDLILHNKKELLSFTKVDGSVNTCRFLFSKWTLKDGWDNPNVFTIAKLRSSGSENSKLQEVGRGLRLPVDEFGNRISNEDFMLNYIIDFTEADFAEKLVAEINSDIPEVKIDRLNQEDLERVANARNVEPNELLITLLSKHYINGVGMEINKDSIAEFYSDFPEFIPNGGVGGSKIKDRNKGNKNTITIRKAQFDELKELWAQINRKFVIFYNEEVDNMVEDNFASLLNNHVFTNQTISSSRQIITTNNETASVETGTGVEYDITGRSLPYNVFLQRANKATSVPIPVIHAAICNYATHNNFSDDFINEASLTRLIQEFEDWKAENLIGRIHYKSANYNSKTTALTDSRGKLLKEIAQARIGLTLTSGTPSEKYLYDAIAYDSPLERDNIITDPSDDVSEVVVYGKIPRKSISIPTISKSSYSPDFMYVVKRANGDKELNIIIETKDVENKTALRSEEKIKINCAKAFFEQLTLDGYTVHFKEQINNKTIKTIITELINTPEGTVQVSKQSKSTTSFINDVNIKDSFVKYLPFYSLRAACGKLGSMEKIDEEERWVDASNIGKLNKDMFVVKAAGDSMKDKIHDGDLCVFRHYDSGHSYQGNIVLVQMNQKDSDYDGTYTIKVFQKGEKKQHKDADITYAESVTLLPINTEYEPISVSGNATDFAIIGEFVGIIN